MSGAKLMDTSKMGYEHVRWGILITLDPIPWGILITLIAFQLGNLNDPKPISVGNSHDPGHFFKQYRDTSLG
jgi:hypothetical protein